MSWSAEAARDRLSSTAFLAALFHGLVILGVSFGAGSDLSRDSSSSMEVVLVTADYESRPEPAEAVLLAQQNLLGAGNAPADAALHTAIGHRLPAEAIGPVQPGSALPQQAGGDNAADRQKPVLTTRSASVASRQPGDPRPAEQQQTTLPAMANAIDLVGRLDARNQVPDDRPRELLISANTRESRIASYLNVWKRRVEQVGTLNFPQAAHRQGQTSYPVLEVAIRADGSLKDVVVLSSSGQRSLDQAAMDILRMSAPFEPFPPTLRDDYDVLRFAYEWRFSEGVGSVRTAAAGT